MERNLSTAIKIVFCGGLAFFCSFIDRLSWPPVMPMASRELGLTAAQAGGFMSAFFLGYLLTQLPGGMLADRLGTRKVLLGSLFFMGIFTIGMAWIPGYWTGTVLRFFAGIGSGAVLAASVKGVYDHFGPDRRATAMGFFMASSPLGLLMANLLSPMIAASYGWRSSFTAAGGFTLLVLAISWLVLPRQTKARHQATSTAVAGGNTLRTLVGNRDLMLTAAAGFFAMWGTWGTLTWANTYMNQCLGLSLQQSGQIMAMFGLGALIGQPLAGWLADFLPRSRRQVGMTILALFAVLLWVFGNNQDSGQLVVLAPLLGAGAFVFGPVINTFISELVSAPQVGTAIGLCNGVWQLGSVISPLTAGFFLDITGNYTWAFAVLAAGPFLAVLLFAFVRSSGVHESR